MTSSPIARVRRTLRRPYPGSGLAASVHVFYGFLAGLVLTITVLVEVIVTVSLVPTIIGAIVSAVILLYTVDGAAHFERWRFRVILEVPIDAPFQEPMRGPKSFWARLTDSTTWRAIGYDLLLLPLSTLAFALVVTAWSGGLALAALPTYYFALPHGLFGLGWGGREAALLTVAGVVLLLLVVPLTRAVTGLGVATARTLLGATGEQRLAARVERLEQTRAGAVESADQERQRIERDLHDGAQQRLVSLAMTLGAARQRLEADGAAQGVVAEAHEEVKQALAELRALVRGFGPPVLTDRGLDAALSGLAARCPVPVDLRVDVTQRPNATVEAVAYFVVSEALTNVAKHAHASRVLVAVSQDPARPDGPWLRIVVEDDGAGGADAAGGTGLQGLSARVAAVDGEMDIVSPMGGPTRLVVELPCAS